MLLLAMLLLVQFAVAQESSKTATAGEDSLPQVVFAKGKVDFALQNLNFSAIFEAKMVGEDSAVISFFGPMGVLLGKAFSNRERFVYYDVFNNWAVVGKPTREKIFNASQVPLSFVDFVRLFKGALLYPLDSMKSYKTENGKSLFSYKGKDFVDFFLVDDSLKLLQFQKKSLEDKILINILYTEYFNEKGILFPKKYIMQIEERKGYVSLAIESLSFEVDTTKQFSFHIPKSVEIFEFY
jgi:hypothetical protein